MPELPDIELYLHALRPRIEAQPLERLRLGSPFLLRTVDPPASELEGREVAEVSRLGKRIVLRFADDSADLFAVLHLMIAGRLQWKDAGAAIPKRSGLAAFDFPTGTLIVTEASKKKRAKLHLVRGVDALRDHDPGGLEPLAIAADAFVDRLRLRNHTLKRALTDPLLFSGIGNAYSDEILWAAQLSPVTWTQRLSDEEAERLYEATRDQLVGWRDALRAEIGERWPKKVTAFRPEMAVHGKYGEPCPRCGDPVQRIRYASNETNYCATCQTGGKLLADRSLSRLLKGDWPRSLEELEEHKAARQK